MRIRTLAASIIPALFFAAPGIAGEDESAAELKPAEPPAAHPVEFKPPPGFRPRKRGQYVVYCRREEPKGSRFPAEVCYDEAGLREMLRTQTEDQVKIDQIRRTRSTTTSF